MLHRSPALDAVRGVAIALVVIYHTGFFEFGWIGVDAFFLLSGYLIGGIVFDRRADPALFRIFYARRAFRILSLYAVSVVICLGSLGATLASVLTLTQNLAWSFGRFPLDLPFSVTWSLAVEEQFYIVLPLLLRFTPQRFIVGLLWVGVIGAPVWRAVLEATCGFNAAFLLLPCRLDTLMGGVLIALWRRGQARKPWLWLGLALYAPAVDLVLLAIGALQRVPPLSLMATPFAVLLFAAVHVRRLPVVLRPLSWFGRGAYSIYLFHLVVLATLPLALAVPVIGLVAAVCGLGIEAPAIRYARRRFRYSDKAAYQGEGHGVSLAAVPPVGTVADRPPA